MALGRLEPAQHLVERVAARDLCEADVGERVERDVDPPQPRFDERRREPVEEDAVRRQREVVHAWDACEHPHQLGHVAADERLPAGEPDLGHAHAREDAHEPLDLLEAQDLVATQPFQALRGHAVRAAEVAFVGDGDTDAPDLAPPAVDERLHAGSVAHRQFPAETSRQGRFVAEPRQAHVRGRHVRDPDPARPGETYARSARQNRDISGPSEAT